MVANLDTGGCKSGCEGKPGAYKMVCGLLRVDRKRLGHNKWGAPFAPSPTATQSHFAIPW